MAENDPMLAMDSSQESAAVPNYNMMGYQSMMAGYDNGYGNGYGGASRPNYANFAHRTGGVAAGSQSAGNSGNSAASVNNGGAAGNGGNDYDYMAASDASNRQISNGIGVSGYGGGYGGNAGYSGGYGGFNGVSGAGARFGGGSGYGGGGGGYTPVNVLGSGYGAVCGDEGLSPALVLGTLVGSAVAFAILFRQVTLSRKKRRDFSNDDDSFGFDGVVGWLGDLAWNGEYFFCKYIHTLTFLL